MGPAALVSDGLSEATERRSAVDALGSVDIVALAAVSMGGDVIFLTIGAVPLVPTAFAPTGARAIGLAAGFVLISYALDYLVDVWTVAEPLGPLSIFHYYDPGVILGDGAIPAADAIGLIGVPSRRLSARI